MLDESAKARDTKNNTVAVSFAFSPALEVNSDKIPKTAAKNTAIGNAT